MLQYALDTDHVTLYEYFHPFVYARVAAQRLLGTVGISIVTVEESLRGRLSALAQARNGPTRILRYAKLEDTLRLSQSFPILPYDQSAENYVQQLLAQRLRIGTQDLKIASIALANNLTLLTRNRRDFARIPGLQIDDWSV
jgi:tRNA(fMet)-specific endonuclease VapC